MQDYQKRDEEATYEYWEEEITVPMGHLRDMVSNAAGQLLERHPLLMRLQASEREGGRGRLRKATLRGYMQEDDLLRLKYVIEAF